jgi:hypothetical protein
MREPNELSNVIWLDRRRPAGARDDVVNLQAELARERHMLATLKAKTADVGDLERCVELIEAMLTIARA